MVMKKFVLSLIVCLASVSCRITDLYLYEGNPMTDKNISSVCDYILEDRVITNLTYFYNAYYIARFVGADAETKVSPHYDLIRTGLSGSDGKYEFDYEEYEFSGEDFFGSKGACEIILNYRQSVFVEFISEGEWKISSQDGTCVNVKVLYDGMDAIRMSLDVDGEMTEESEFSADFVANGLQVSFLHSKIGKTDSKLYDGEMLVEFYEGASLVKSCQMIMTAGLSTQFKIF